MCFDAPGALMYLCSQSQLGNAYNEGLDEMLERVVSFFDVIQGVPVVFSILILVLGSRRANEPIPANRSELYMAAITAALARRVGRDQVDMASEMYVRMREAIIMILLLDYLRRLRRICFCSLLSVPSSLSGIVKWQHI